MIAGNVQGQYTKMLPKVSTSIIMMETIKRNNKCVGSLVAFPLSSPRNKCPKFLGTHKNSVLRAVESVSGWQSGDLDSETSEQKCNQRFSSGKLR